MTLLHLGGRSRSDLNIAPLKQDKSGTAVGSADKGKCELSGSKITDRCLLPGATIDIVTNLPIQQHLEYVRCMHHTRSKQLRSRCGPRVVSYCGNCKGARIGFINNRVNTCSA